MIYSTREISNNEPLLLDYGEHYWLGSHERKHRRVLEMCLKKEVEKNELLERRLADSHNHGVENADAARARLGEEVADLRRQVVEQKEMTKVAQEAQEAAQRMKQRYQDDLVRWLVQQRTREQQNQSTGKSMGTQGQGQGGGARGVANQWQLAPPEDQEADSALQRPGPGGA